MGVINFLPIQEGEGVPSPENKRPVRFPLNIDGIGMIGGGSIDTFSGKLTAEWAVQSLASLDGLYLYQSSATVRRYRSNNIPVKTASSRNDNFHGMCETLRMIPYNGSWDYTYRVSPLSNGTGAVIILPIMTETELSEYLNNTLLCYELYAPVEYQLTTAQLHQALDQLKTYYGELPITQMPDIRRRIILNEPHLITPTAAELHMFSTNMVAPLRECRVHFSPVQEGKGDASPENERPISGWTGIDLYRTGENYARLNPISSRGLTLAGDGRNIVTVNGKSTSAGSVTITEQFIANKSGNVVCGGVIRDGVVSGTAQKKLFLWDSNIRADAISNITTKKTGSIVVDHGYILAFYTSTNVQYNDFIIKPFVCDEETFIDEEISWQSSTGTVYGGYVDPVNGEIVEEWKKLNVANARISLNTALTGVDRWYFGVSDFINTTITTAPEIMTNIYKPYNLVDANNNKMNWVVACQGRTLYFYTPPGTYNNANEFVSGLQDSSIVFKLATPIHHPIDPVILKTLRGLNNIWSNANGVIELSYWKH